VTLEATLEDMQGKFNLNWLVNNTATGTGQVQNQTPNGILAGGNNTANGGVSGTGLTPPGPNPGAVKAFNKLLELVGVDIQWTDKIIDWIDTDNQPQNQGAEDSAYLGQNPPYLAANRYITSITELLALPNFGRDNFRKLAPYISALPPSSQLNICTAPAVVLDAFSSQQTSFSTDAQGFAKTREAAQGCFPDKTTYTTQILTSQDLQGLPNAAGSTGGTGFFSSSSQYFRLSSLITIGTTEYNLYSLLYVDKQGNYAHPLQRSFSPD
jgi:general secretion pathway protein K